MLFPAAAVARVLKLSPPVNTLIASPMAMPRVAGRIRRGATMSAADYIELVAARRDWIARMEKALEPYDALLSPTVPILAPPMAPLVAEDDAFFAANNLLLRNPFVVNFLDGCALSLPCHRDGELPVGLMLWGAAMRDDAAKAGITILVSHRFSTVRMANLIVVLDGARVVEMGTHDELLARRGQYAELYGIQAAAYQ